MFKLFWYYIAAYKLRQQKMASQRNIIIRAPDTLYELCLCNTVTYVSKTQCNKDDLQKLPDNVLMDIYYKMMQLDRLCLLGTELAVLSTFDRLLRDCTIEQRLLQCFQAVIQHGSKLPNELCTAYISLCDPSSDDRHYLITLGLRLGGFLNSAGWYPEAERVLLACRALCLQLPPSARQKRLTLECCHRLLNTQSAYCCFPAAADTYKLALNLLGIPEKTAADLEAKIPPGPYAMADTCHQSTQTDLPISSTNESDAICCSVGRVSVEGVDNLVIQVFKEFSGLFFVRCDYNAAYKWGMHALNMLTPNTPPKISVEVIRACGKACVVKREFRRAGVLVRQAVAQARLAFGNKHPRFAAALHDYGFYLLNIDTINQSVAVYEEALNVLKRVYGRFSLHVATAQEDLAYALYVLEYSSGRFYKAREHAERAIRILEKLVPRDHLLLASAKRVKALILEEIALDTPPGHELSEPNLLDESEALHKVALDLSMMAFGEKNVQTAKHYGNLGRLYQSMQKFQDAEAMHLKAIAIKEELLGPDDFEVGLSIGHLASLYNYHMNMHSAAEKLYYRSISISLKLFGERYSGLEYDYRGLVHVFTQLKRLDRANFYNSLLHHWHELRVHSRNEETPNLGEEELLPLDELKSKLLAEGPSCRAAAAIPPMEVE